MQHDSEPTKKMQTHIDIYANIYKANQIMSQD